MIFKKYINKFNKYNSKLGFTIDTSYNNRVSCFL